MSINWQEQHNKLDSNLLNSRNLSRLLFSVLIFASAALNKDNTEKDPIEDNDKTYYEKAGSTDSVVEIIIRRRMEIKKPLKFQNSLKIRENYKSKNVFYVGDSYMHGLTNEGGVKRNRRVKTSRPFVFHPLSSNKNWENDDVATHAIKTVYDSNCKLLVLNGGLNDLHIYYDNLEETLERIKKTYQKIIAIAKNREIRVVILDIPKIPKLPLKKERDKEKRLAKKEEINDYTDKLNEALAELAEQDGVDVIDTDALIDGNWRDDNIHPNTDVYGKFFDLL